MKKYILYVICCLLIFTSTESVFAQPGMAPSAHGQGFTGPAQVQGFTGPQSSFGQASAAWNTTVNQARNLPHDSWVVLTGNIINMLPGGRQYTFRDTTGDIAVDIGPKEWRGLSVEAADRVEIHGEVKSHRGLIHIKVQAIRKTGA